MSRLYYRFRSACSKVSLFHNFSFKLVADSSSGSALAPEIPAAQTEMLLVQCCLILWNVQVDTKKIDVLLLFGEIIVDFCQFIPFRDIARPKPKR